MLQQCKDEINRQGAGFRKFSNQWNVMQQLIDIVSVQPDSAEIVLQDLQVSEMNLNALTNKITGRRLADLGEAQSNAKKKTNGHAHADDAPGRPRLA